MEIANPIREARVKDLTTTNFEIQSINLEEAQHDTKVGLWKATTKFIEEELEELKLSKVKLNVEIHVLNSFIWQLVTPLASIAGVPSTIVPTITYIQTIINQTMD